MRSVKDVAGISKPTAAISASINSAAFIFPPHIFIVSVHSGISGGITGSALSCVDLLILGLKDFKMGYY